MATQEEKIAAVTACVDSFAALETHLQAAGPLFEDLAGKIGTAYGLGIGRQGEFLRVTNGLKGALGRNALALEKVIEIHELCTKVAKREDCDVAIPDAFAIDGGVSPMGSGGGR